VFSSHKLTEKPVNAREYPFKKGVEDQWDSEALPNLCDFLIET